ncbi:MAG: DUF3465 domain-containing protein [Candidatus Dormibacteraeota bacterium]|nr:DUF3465 domain-containing protein [Candidatus Dormibacteraeota bacterium]
MRRAAERARLTTRERAAQELSPEMGRMGAEDPLRAFPAAPLRRILAAAVIALSLTTCANGRDAADDQTLHQDVVNNANGAEVTFDATVVSDPVKSGSHERFVVKATTGEVLEIDHNISLAAYVPVHTGDHLVVHGKLYIDPGPKIGVHCTHSHTSSGCPIPGWIQLGSNYYE